MKMKMFISNAKSDFLVNEEAGLDGTEVVSISDPVYLVQFEPVLLDKKEYLQLLGKAKKHEIEVVA